jgi:hypothetical protein
MREPFYYYYPDTGIRRFKDAKRARGSAQKYADTYLVRVHVFGRGRPDLGYFEPKTWSKKNPASVIPLKWTPAGVRRNAKGQVQVAIGRKHAAR